MTITETTPSIAPQATAPADSTAAPARTFSIVAFALSVAAIAFGQGFPLAVLGIVFGVVGYRQEPAARSFSVWAIVLGGVALFGWIIFAIVGLAFAAPFLAFAWM